MTGRWTSDPEYVVDVKKGIPIAGRPAGLSPSWGIDRSPVAVAGPFEIMTRCPCVFLSGEVRGEGMSSGCFGAEVRLATARDGFDRVRPALSRVHSHHELAISRRTPPGMESPVLYDQS